MISVILQLLGAGLSIWEHKEKNKYADKFAQLKRDYYEESKKDTPDNARLDNIEFELHILSNSFATEVKRSTIDSV